jgi:hypothetical protein
MWNPGDCVALRGIANERVWLAQSVIVVQDTTEETILLLTPGAQCAYPEGYWRWKHDDYSMGTRWDDAKSNAWVLREFAWQTNRLLMFLEPQKYYSTFYFWDHATDQFVCYYVNFQLPYRRSHCGFDTLDLELDLVIDPKFCCEWKDEEFYREGIREGCIQKKWMEEIELAKPEVLARIHERRHPLDGSWINWKPAAAWSAPGLPKRWQEVQ